MAKHKVQVKADPLKTFPLSACPLGCAVPVACPSACIVKLACKRPCVQGSIVMTAGSHDCHSLSVYCAHVAILKETNLHLQAMTQIILGYQKLSEVLDLAAELTK